MAAVGHRCRLCTANDREALVEELAQQLWDGQRGGTLDDWPWSETSEYWRTIFRQFARTAIETMERPDGVAPSSHPQVGGSSTGRAA